MKMSRRKVRETIFLLLFRVEFNTQEELQEQIKWYFEERSISRQRLEVS